MRFGKSIVLATVVLIGCASNNVQPPTNGKQQAGDELNITNFRSGLMRRDGANWYVYESGNEFQYKPNGECVVVGVRKPCLWYGFTFDYVAPQAGTELDCTMVRNRPQHMVTPTAEHGIMSGAQYRLRLPNKSGRYQTMGYQTPKNELPGKAASKTVCTYEGRTVLEYEFGVVFTASDIADAI